MKIVKLSIKNFLKLKDVELNPSKTNVIVGKNKQGKTSILKAIQAAFEGKLDESSIRLGENKAEITVELEELTIKRSVTEKGSYLDISNREGLKMPTPQKFLDGILGTFSFNPIEFFELKPIERKKYLLNAIKMTLTKEELYALVPEIKDDVFPAATNFDRHALEVVDYIHKEYYSRRTVANAEVTKKRKSLDDLAAKLPEGFDPSKVSEAEITKLRDAIQLDEKERAREKAHLDFVASLQKQEVDTLNEIERLKVKLADIQKELTAAKEEKFNTSDDETIRIAKESLAKLESQRELVFTHKRVEELRGELSTAVQEADKLDTVVNRLAKEVPQALVSKAKLPVEGLAVTETDVVVNGVSLDNLSSSEQLKFALQIVRSLNTSFKIVCIDGVERLDGETFEAFLKEIENDEFQYFVSRVDGAEAEKKGYVLVEDGEIKTAPNQK